MLRTGRPAYTGFIHGSGLTANFSTTPLAPGASLPARFPPPPLSTTPAAAGGPTVAVAVSSYSALLAAVADPSVASVTLSADVRFPPGSPLVVAGAARSLSISSAAAACPAGGCALDGGGASQLFRVSGGARLRLSGVTLRRCSAVQGGCALVSGQGSSLSADSCTFADSTATADGGCALAVSSASLAFTNTTFRNCLSVAGSGGAAAALFGSSVTAAGCSFASCGAQWGAGLSALNASYVSASDSSFTSCSAWYGGAAAARWYSTLSLRRGTLLGNSAFRDGIGIGGATVAAFFSASTVSDSYLFNNSAARGGGSGARENAKKVVV